ncbi:cellulose binding domain-containing protein [Alteromonas sp. KUL49]|uniref:cellulose binding domain-containing protein n=1 Tax=Alteromonas sp. KUL49 TaxID=2480798 RepID=UPI00102EE58F|nr:cellulose binding domain-containing protein [Alteromonas sp. KUL49]TAP36842.1 PKD domain-containing protein [Alteromonas sp. KUL49]GEA13104.1 hypothetical protein KUL49_34790 [Alteromonas sp. KUL49]
MASTRVQRLLLLLSLLFSHSLFAAQCDYVISNEWNTGFTASVTITNDSAQDISGWVVNLDYPDSSTITNMWNADLSGSNPFTASNKGYNGNLRAGSSISFGFNGQKGVSGSPAVIPSLSGVCSNVTEEPEPPVTELARCEFTVANEWQSGFTGKVTVYNDDAATINGWQVTMLFPDATSVSGAWNSSFSGGNPYTFNNANYNANVPPNGSQSFGFNAQKGTSGGEVQIPQLGGICGEIVEVNNPPTAVATATPTQGTAPLTVTFDGTGSTDEEGDALTYLWSFEDGTTQSTSEFSYSFETAGDYLVNLVVNDGADDSEAVSVSISVTEPIPTGTYALDGDSSSLYFVSTKKTHVVETHTFTSLTGSINEQGEARVAIDLDSVETGIDVRNQRMRDYLFETASFGEAVITAQVDAGQLAAMQAGEVVTQLLSADVDLHGVVVPLDLTVRVTKLSDTTVLVQNTMPININAADFALVDGIEQLRNLAGLSVISYAVPTNFTLVFSTQL